MVPLANDRPNAPTQCVRAIGVYAPERRLSMTDDNQNETMPTPQPLPGQVFIRPSIDDRPDYEKTLTPEAKAALKRLAVQQRPRVPEASNERPEVQATRLVEGGSPLTAAAHLDAAVPNLESSFLDLRDPMTAPDGSRPNALQVNRLTAGFALGSLLFAAPIAALDVVLIPQRIDQLVGDGRVAGLALTMALGQLLGIFVAVYRTTHPAESGWDGTTRSGIMLFAIWFIVAGIVTLLVLPREGSSTYMPRESVRKGSFFSQYRPPKHAPKFAVAFIARILAVAATTLIAVYQWYLAASDLDADGLSGYGLTGAGAVVALMAVAAFVGSLMAALLLGPIARAFEDARVPAVISCMLFVIGAAAPCMMADKLFGVAIGFMLLAGVLTMLLK